MKNTNYAILYHRFKAKRLVWYMPGETPANKSEQVSEGLMEISNAVRKIEQEKSDLTWNYKNAVADLIRVIEDNSISTIFTPELLAKLAKRKEKEIRRVVAALPEAPFEDLVSDPDVGVRLAIAGNPHAPSEILVKLASDPNVGVRRQVASHLGTPGDVLAKLTADPDVEVTIRAVRNNNLPEEVLVKKVAGGSLTRWKLTKDSNNSRKTNISMPRGTFERRLDASLDELIDLALNPDSKVRYEVAKNRDTSRLVLTYLGSDPDVNVRCEVVFNTNTPKLVRAKMAALDSSSYVRKIALKNMNTAKEV